MRRPAPQRAKRRRGLSAKGKEAERDASATKAVQKQIVQLKQSAKVKGPEASKELLAVTILKKHPEWTHQQIADAAGCNRTSLFRMPVYKSAKKLLALRPPPPGGYKDHETGEIDAFSDDLQ